MDSLRGGAGESTKNRGGDSIQIKKSGNNQNQTDVAINGKNHQF
jgi:hypothetical protein